MMLVSGTLVCGLRLCHTEYAREWADFTWVAGITQLCRAPWADKAGLGR